MACAFRRFASLLLPGANLFWCVVVGRARAHRRREDAITFAPAKRGRGTTRRVVEGAAERTTMRAPRKTVQRAQRLRRALSAPEVTLWSRLRDRASGKPVFRRQHPIGPYVLDFYCAKARLAIELDGASHDLGARPRHDLRRDAWLKARGITVVRVPVNNLMGRVDEVADAIGRMAADFP